jgi:hypothetical protein
MENQMRIIVTATATAASLLFFVAGTPASQAAPVGPIAQQSILNADLGLIEKTQFFFGGRNFCWYPVGWHGAGWYWCGYAWRHGFGWGGGYGWNGWARPGFGPRPGPRPGFGPRRAFAPRGGGPRGGGPRGRGHR